METLKLLCDFFPTAVYTGRSLLFISEDWRVELTEHKDSDYTNTDKAGQSPLIRVRISKKAINGEYISRHFEDFRLGSPNELAAQIEKYVHLYIGLNLHERTDLPERG